MFQTLVNRFSVRFSKRKAEKEKETKRRVLVYQPFAEVDAVDQNDVNQKVRETVFAKILNPGWEGVKSIPKTSQSLPINGSAMRADLFEDLYSCGVKHQQCGGIL